MAFSLQAWSKLWGSSQVDDHPHRFWGCLCQTPSKTDGDNYQLVRGTLPNPNPPQSDVFVCMATMCLLTWVGLCAQCLPSHWISRHCNHCNSQPLPIVSFEIMSGLQLTLSMKSCDVSTVVNTVSEFTQCLHCWCYCQWSDLMSALLMLLSVKWPAVCTAVDTVSDSHLSVFWVRMTYLKM